MLLQIDDGPCGVHPVLTAIYSPELSQNWWKEIKCETMVKLFCKDLRLFHKGFLNHSAVKIYGSQEKSFDSFKITSMEEGKERKTDLKILEWKFCQPSARTQEQNPVNEMLMGHRCPHVGVTCDRRTRLRQPPCKPQHLSPFWVCRCHSEIGPG